MLKAVKITKTDENFSLVKALYESAFPENERVDLEKILYVSNTIDCGIEILAIFDDNIFVGFIITMSVNEITHVLYFAVDDKLRSSGYGSKILKLIHDNNQDKIFMLDVEKPKSKSSNNEQREKRIKFYSKNGYLLNDIKYKWCGEHYLVMSYGKKISKKEHKKFWKQRSDIMKKLTEK